MSNITAKEELDCRGMNCPLPILKTKKAIEGLASGEVLKMTATDPGSVNDMDSWAKRTGNKIVDQEENAGEFTFYIEKQ